MKNTLVLVGIAASILVSVSAHADPESFRTGDNLAQGGNHKKAAARSHAQRQTVYITNKTVTGSNIPLVVGRYGGRYDSMAPTAVYGRPSLDRTGQLNVQGELAQRDPAISSAGGGFRR